MSIFKNLVIVFAKPPVPGGAKTRLIPALGANGAANFHVQMVKNTLQNVCSQEQWQVQLWAANQLMPEFFQQCAHDYAVEIRLQQGNDLGERMFNAINQSLPIYEKVILIGTDCPGIDCALINKTFEQLDGADLLITPAEDGGYVLIGAKKIEPIIFADVAWGSNRVMQQTILNLEKLSLQTIVTDSLWDIDIPKDLERWRREYYSQTQALASDLPSE